MKFNQALFRLENLIKKSYLDYALITVLFVSLQTIAYPYIKIFLSSEFSFHNLINSELSPQLLKIYSLFIIPFLLSYILLKNKICCSHLPVFSIFSYNSG